MYPAHEWTTPFGFPVDPDVYKINKGSSLFMISGSHTKACFDNNVCQSINIPCDTVLVDNIHVNVVWNGSNLDDEDHPNGKTFDSSFST